MKSLLKSSSLQIEFDKNGFIKVPLLNAAKADELLRLYRSTEEEHRKINLPFITSSHSNDHGLIRKVDGLIAGILVPEMEKILCNYQLLFGNFLVKMPGPDSATPLHQDTTFVDESKFSSITVWVALQDTDEANGCMQFIKGSHKFIPSLRPTHSYPWPYEKVKMQLEKLLVSYPCKKGDAFIFDHRVIHASFANNSSTPRIAAIMAAYPDEADLLMLFSEKDNISHVHQYKMTKEAYLHFIKGEPPQMGELMKTIPFDFKQLTESDFKRLIRPKWSLLNKIALWGKRLNTLSNS